MNKCFFFLFIRGQTFSSFSNELNSMICGGQKTVSVFVCECYLPGVASPPAGLCGDAQSLAARFLGHEGELSHCAASETMERGWRGDGHHGCLSNQEEEKERERERMGMHAAG